MYIAMNRFKTVPGRETDFENMENEIESDIDTSESTDSAQKTLDFF